MGDDEPTRLETIRSNWNGFRHFMWNSEEKTVMGRGGKSWAKISLFYFVYYTCLAGFWAALLAIFLQTVSFNRPTWTALVSTPGERSDVPGAPGFLPSLFLPVDVNGCSRDGDEDYEAQSKQDSIADSRATQQSTEDESSRMQCEDEETAAWSLLHLSEMGVCREDEEAAASSLLKLSEIGQGQNEQVRNNRSIGLSVVPVPNEDFRISWEPDRPESYERITKEIAEIIDGLQPPNGDDLEDCTTGPAGSIANGQRFCGFDVAKLGPCNNPPNYGWDTLKPCLFLRLNRVFGWIPENYDNKDDIPERVREAGIYMDDNVAIGCFPRRDDDKKIIVNATTMPFPRNGIPFGFFPYALGTNMEDRNRLIQPVVAVQVPFSIANEGVNLECETYTGNILPRNGLFDTDELSRFRIHLTPKRDN